METFDRQNIDKLLEIRQIHQYFPVKILRRTVIIGMITTLTVGLVIPTVV